MGTASTARSGLGPRAIILALQAEVAGLQSKVRELQQQIHDLHNRLNRAARNEP